MAKWVAERLTALAQVRGLSQRALARHSGLKPEVVSRAFRGLHTPSVATLERLCAGFGISLSEFFAEGLAGEVMKTVVEPVGKMGAAGTSDTARLDLLLADLEPRVRAQAVRGLELFVRSLVRPAGRGSAGGPAAETRKPKRHGGS